MWRVTEKLNLLYRGESDEEDNSELSGVYESRKIEFPGGMWPSEGRGIYVHTDGTLYMVMDSQDTYKHDELVDGSKKVYMAGEVQFDRDRVIFNNKSGHYKPEEKDFIAWVDHFLQGAVVCDEDKNEEVEDQKIVHR